MIELALLKNFRDELKKSALDDIVDRCHYFFTVLLLILFALLVGGKQLFGHPIYCMAPAEYNGHWGRYVEQYCYVTRTYVAERGRYEPVETDERVDVSYYQWVPYILGLQALLFYAPHFLWKYMLAMSDIDFKSVVDQCAQASSTMVNSEEKKKKSDSNVVKHLHRIYNSRHINGVPQSGLGNIATASYLGFKLLNLLVVFSQFYFIEHFVGRGQVTWGFKVLFDSMRGVYWDNNGFFPRVTFCDFGRESLGNLQTKMAQCVLPINYLNEKIFLVLYFWFLFLLLLTLGNFFYTLAVFFVGQVRLRYGGRFLKLLEGVDSSYKDKSELISAFIVEVLGRDGLLLLRFIESHAGNRQASEVACSFFKEVTSGGAKDEYFKI